MLAAKGGAGERRELDTAALRGGRCPHAATFLASARARIAIIVRRPRSAPAVVAGVFALVLAPSARADTTIVGSSDLASNAPAIDNLGQDIPVFQGAASGGYVLSSPTDGTITSWRFRSGGICP